MPKLVYAFTEGNKDMKDLLGGKGANLAEMTNIGLPVPPGFTITTEACRYYLQHGSTPEGLDGEIAAHLDKLEHAMGRKLGDPADPLLVSVRFRGEVLHAGHDGHRPEHRPVRRVRAGPGQAVRQRAVRLGRLPPPDPDVRQDRARRRRRSLRARPRRRQAGQRGQQRHRPGRRRPAEPRRDVQGHRPQVRQHGVPAGPQPAGEPGHQRRVRLVEHPPGGPVPPPGAHPFRPGHGGERGRDGLRKPRRWTRAPAWPSPATPAAAPRASTAITCRTPRARTWWPASGTPCRCRTWSASTRPRSTS